MKSNTFRNYLIIILLSMVVPMLIVLLIEYRLMGKEIIGQAQNNENRMLEECTEKYDASIQSIRRVSAQLMEYFGQGGKENAFLEKNLDDKFRILNDFSVLQDNEIIQSYYVFYLNENRMIINGSFYDPGYIKDQDFFLFPEIKECAACNVWKPEREYCEETNKKTVRTVTWLRSFPIGEAEPQGYIAINVDFRKLTRLFFVSEAREYSIRTIQGETLFATGEYNSEDYLIFSGGSKEMAWIYENAVEEKNLLMSLGTIKRIMSVICVIGVLGCIVISLVTSQFIYRPMQELLHFIKVDKKKGVDDEYELIKKKFIQNEHERMDMEEKNKRFEPVYYENLVRSLLTNQHLGETDKMDESLFIHSASCYQVVVFYDYQMRMQGNSLWKNIKSIIQKDIDISLKFTGTQIQKNIAAIVCYSERKEDMIEKIMHFAVQAQTAIMHKNGVSVSIGISRSCETYDQFPEMYTQALEATYYHIYFDDRRPVLYDDVSIKKEEQEDNAEKYPIGIERKILGGLKGQQTVAVTEQTEEFFRIIQERKLASSVVKMWVNTLKFSILSLAEHTGIDLWEEMDTQELCRDIDVNYFNNIGEVKAIIERYLRAYLNVLNGSADDKYKELVEAVRKYVVDHVSEDISLSVVADRYKVSVPYLSTIFKKQTGENFVKFLIEVKMSFAAELLLETKMTVSDIAEKTGYTNLNSFSNAFKKYYGITPSRYRFEKVKDEK